MPYVNSRGEVVEKREWAWDSPIVAIISLFNVIRLFFMTMFGASEPENKKSDGPRRGGFGSSGGGWGGGGGGGSGGGGGGSGPRGGRGGFATMSDIRPPPASSPCAGGSCPR